MGFRDSDGFGDLAWILMILIVINNFCVDSAHVDGDYDDVAWILLIWEMMLVIWNGFC